MAITRIVAMGLNTDHLPGEQRYYPEGQPHYTLIQMLTPGYITTSHGIQRIGPMECVLYDPYSPRTIRPLDEKVSFRNNWLFVTNDCMTQLLEQYGIKTSQIYRPEITGSIADCLGRLFQEYIRLEPADGELSDLIVRQILIYLSRAAEVRPDETFVNNANYERLMQIRTEIYSNVAFDWNVEELARSMYMSAAWFTTLYQRQYGISPKQDILRARLEYAKASLAYSNVPLREVARESGFQNEYYFSRIFRKAEGIPPGEYRSLHFGKV